MGGRRAASALPPAANRLLANAVSPTSLEFGLNSGHTDGTHFRMLIMADYAPRQPIDWGGALIGSQSLACPISIVCDPAGRAAIREQANRADADAELASAGAKGRLSDRVEAELAAEESLSAARMALRDNVRMVEARLYVCLRARHRDALDDAEDYLARTLLPTGNALRAIAGGQEAMYFAASPYCADDEAAYQQFAFPMPARTVAWFFPFRQYGVCDDEGVEMGDDGMGGKVRLALEEHTRERMNSNIAITGMSGCGKSATLCHVVLNEWLMGGCKVLWIDPESEGVRLAGALAGTVVRIGGTSQSAISPFEPRDAGSGDEDAPEGAAAGAVLASTIPFAKTFLQMAFDIPDAEAPYLRQALECAYALYGISPETTFSQYAALPEGSYPGMRDLYDVLRAFDAECGGAAGEWASLAMRIRSAAVGADAARWNMKTSIDDAADIVLISTENLSADESMRRAEYYNVLSWCWSKIRQQRYSGRYVRLVADELHTIVNRECAGAAMQVKDIVQRIRKYGGGFLGATPQMADLLAPEVRDVGLSIIQNSAYRLYGRANSENLAAVAETEGLADEVARQLRDAGRGRFVLCAGARERSWCNVRIPDWELALFGRAGGR